MGSGNPNADPPSSLAYTITALPVHGALEINGAALQLGGQFTQDQVDNNLLTYTEDGSTAASDSFGFSISDIGFHNNFGSGTFDISVVDTNGGRIFMESSASETFYSGPGNNWIVGAGDTTLSYAIAPAGVNVNLANGTALNGFGGTDHITDVHLVIGSPYDDALTGGAVDDSLTGSDGNDMLVGSAGNDTIIGGDGTDTAAYSGNHSDYAFAYNVTTQAFTVADERAGSPDGTDTVSQVEQFQFADGTFTLNTAGGMTQTLTDTAGTMPWTSQVSSFDASGSLTSQTVNNDNGTHWTNEFDTAGTASWTWRTTAYDANGQEVSQSGTNDDGTHWLTLYDAANAYSWANITISFDANWNRTGLTGTRDDGSHTVTNSDIIAAYDTLTWFSTPFDANWNSTPVDTTLGGGGGKDVLYGHAGNDTLNGAGGTDIPGRRDRKRHVYILSGRGQRRHNSGLRRERRDRSAPIRRLWGGRDIYPERCHALAGEL